MCAQKKLCGTFTCRDPVADVEGPCIVLTAGDQYTDATCGLNDEAFAGQQAALAAAAGEATDTALGVLLPILLIALGAAALFIVGLVLILVWVNALKKQNRELEGIALGRGVTSGTKVKRETAIVVGKALAGAPEDGFGSDDPFAKAKEKAAMAVSMNPLAMKSHAIDDAVEEEPLGMGMVHGDGSVPMAGFNPMAQNRRSMRG